MLKLIESGFGSSGHEELIKNIKQTVEKNKRGFLIVPEQQTVTAENEMSIVLPPSAPLTFEVTNFTRFSNTAFRQLGGICAEYCDNVGKALIMWKTLTELSPLLSLTKGKANVYEGNVKMALSAVSEMQSLGISPEKLAETEKLTDNSDIRLKSKLSDLSMIYTLFKRLLTEKFSDIQDDTLTLANMIEENPDFLTDTKIFVEGFTSFTEPQYKLLGALMKRTEVNILLTLPKADFNSYEYKEVRECHERLVNIADKQSVEKKIARPDGKAQDRSLFIDSLAPYLFKSFGEFNNEDLEFFKEDMGRVKLYEADTPFDECDFLASDIKRQITLGEKYGDFAIVARRAEDYIGILDSSLQKAHIPYFVSKNSDINSLEGIKLIYTAYAIILGGFRKEDVLTYLKCGLSSISRDDRDLFEMYVDRWDIDKVRFIDGILWNMNPRGFSDLFESDSQNLIRLNRTRQTVVEPLLDFQKRTETAKTVREHAEALLSFLSSINLEDQLVKKAKELYSLGEVENAEENSKLWQIICDSLDTVVGILGDVNADAESFINQLTVVFSEKQVGKIPAHRDEVVIGSADMIRLSNKKHIYLIGVNQREFPSIIQDNSYFNERDKAKLSMLGLPIEPDIETKNARELYIFKRVFTSAKESVTILFTDRTPTLTSLAPSDVIKRIEEVTKGKIKVKKISELPIADRIYTPEFAEEYLGQTNDFECKEIKKALIQLGKSEIVEISEGDIINQNLHLGKEVSALIYKGDMYLSQSKIDKFVGCPFSYYCNYILKLDNGEKATVASNVIGSFMHGIFELFFKEIKEKNMDISAMSREEKIKITSRASERYITQNLSGNISSSRTRVAIDRLSKVALPIVDGLCEELENSRYSPKFFELKIDQNNENAPDPIYIKRDDGRRVVITGIVDRVDTYESGDDVFVKVVDYKTGKKELKKDDIENGKNLQMLLYLRSITETQKDGFKKAIGLKDGGKMIPAGMMYINTTVKDTSIEDFDDKSAEEKVKENISRCGMLLNDSESLGAINPHYLPDKWDKYAYSIDDWDEITRKITEVILKTTDKMTEGNISATPKTSSDCRYCPYKSICRNAK